MSKYKGAKLILKALEMQGVDTVFGYPGGSVIPIFDELYVQDKIKVILPRHEQGGGHATDGYSRATGKVGVVIATSGPGATNLVTALATAKMDSIPMIAITGQVNSKLIGTCAFQEADIVSITKAVTKKNYQISSVEQIIETINEAFKVAISGKPGPVLIDIPVDITQQEIELIEDIDVDFNINEDKVNVNINEDEVNVNVNVNENEIYANVDVNIKNDLNDKDKLVEFSLDDNTLLEIKSIYKESKKPVFLLGGGTVLSNAQNEIRELIEKTNIPAISTLMALGIVDSNDSRNLGMAGMHGSGFANNALSYADLIICIGARFDDRVTSKTDLFNSNAKIVHVDVDYNVMDKTVKSHIQVVGDAKAVSKYFFKILWDKKEDIKEWICEIEKWKKEFPMMIEEREGKVLNRISVKKIFDVINENCYDEKYIFVTEVGQHQMWAAQHLKFKSSRQFLTSGGLGTMGYGFPASIGAQVGREDKQVILLAGDGSFQMNLQELATIRNYNIPVKIIIFNNGYLGMVRQWQEMFYEKKYSSTCLSRDINCPKECDGKNCFKYVPNFEKLANSYNIKAYTVHDNNSFEEVFKMILDMNEPILVDVKIDRFENVMPMVSPGKAIKDFVAK